MSMNFWDFVEKTDYCWNWTGPRSKFHRYGMVTAKGRPPVAAHREAYRLLIGVIPAGLHLDHLCRNRR